MARAALALTFIVAAWSFLISKLGVVYGFEPPRFLDLSLYLPAIALGTWSWCRTATFARTCPVVAAAALGWIGLAWAAPTESHRGPLIAGVMTMVLPVGALVAEQRAWWFSARVYVLATVAALVWTVWCQYQDYGGRVSLSMMRVGSLENASGDGYLTNPNQVGGQLAVASIIAFVLYVRGERRRLDTGGSCADAFSLAWSIILSLGCLLTASRGACCAWAAGMSLAFFDSARRLPASRLRDLVALGIAGVAVMASLSLAVGNTPWSKLYNRIVGDENASLVTAGSRTLIWNYAMRAWWEDPAMRLRGAGTGMADEAVGQFAEIAQPDRYGNLARNCHSAYVEWILSYGLVGIGLGGVFAASVIGTAWQLDAADGVASRLAILLTIGLFSATGDLFRKPEWMANGALVLAMLTHLPTCAAIAGLPRPRSRAASPASCLSHKDKAA